MREYDDAALELRLRGVLREHLDPLPLDLTVDALDRRREVRRDARRRRGLVALGLAAALLVPLGVLGSGGRSLFEAVVVPVPSASPLTTSPSSIPYVITGPTSGPGRTAVTPGTYRLRGPGSYPAGWPSAVIVTIPDQWWARSAVRGAGLVRGEGDGVALAALDVSSVGDLMAHPCRDGSLLTQPIGPSVHDLVAGLISRPGLESSAPVDITVDGWPGVRLELAPTSGCGPAMLWRTNSPPGGESWGVGIGEGWHSRIEIVDIDGLRLVVLSSVQVDAPADVQLELEQMVDTIVIEP